MTWRTSSSPRRSRSSRTSLVLAAAAALALASACRRASSSAAPLLAPQPQGLDAAGPDSFVVRFETTKGAFDLKVHRDWAPRGADRLHWLARHGFYDGARFFRVVPDFVVQFGIPADTAVTRVWRERRFGDDSVTRSNVRGTLSFAMGGPNTRTTQLFINLKDNARLDHLGFAPLAQVVVGMEIVDSLYRGYGEGAPRGKGPSQARINAEGDAYLARDFPLLDRVRRARVVQEWRRRGRA